MLPWIKNYLTKEFTPRPKTIFFGPEGLDVIDLSRLLVTKFVSEIDRKDYSNNALEPSENLFFNITLIPLGSTNTDNVLNK